MQHYLLPRSIPTERICISIILLEPAHKILHTTVKFKRRTISVIPVSRHLWGPCPISRLPCKSFVKLRHGCPGHAQESVQSTAPGYFTRKVCLSASVPALGRTRHPFAVSDSEEPSQKIEFVFSASPETIRREPREFDLLRSVGKMQDLAVCAWFIPFV